MKRWTIFTVIAIIVSVCLVSSYAGISINSSVSRPGMYGSRPSSQDPYRQDGSASSPYVSLNNTGLAPLDPNKVAAAVRAFPGLEQELKKVGRGSRNEVTEWLRPISSTTDNRSRLGREVHKQIAIELDFLRKTAIAEGAKKTAAAIDGIQLMRESRLKKLGEKMKEEKRSATRSKRTGRSRRGRGQTDQVEGAYQEETNTPSRRRR